MTKQQAETIIEKLDKIEKLLFGNGKKGLCEKVRNLELFYRIGFALSFCFNIYIVIKKIAGGIV